MTAQDAATDRPAETDPEPPGGAAPGLMLDPPAWEPVDTPWPFDEFICPACERDIPTRRQIRMAIPTKYEHVLNQVLKCPWCNFIFSPRRVEAKALRR